MSKKGSSAPAPAAPDPYATAAAQTTSNIDTAVANSFMSNPTVVTPYGTSTSVQTGYQMVDGHAVPQFTQYQSLSPAENDLYWQQFGLENDLNNTAQQQLDRVSNTLAQPVDLNSLPSAGNLPTSPDIQGYGAPVMMPGGAAAGYTPQSYATSFGDTSQGVGYGDTTYGATPNYQYSVAPSGNAQSSLGDYGSAQRTISDPGSIQTSIDTPGIADARQQVQDALMARLNPQLQISRDALDTQLRNQGLTPGSQAYDAAIDAAGRQENDARLDVIGQAGQEEDRLFNEAATQGQFANAAQQQSYDQSMGQAGLYNSGQQQDFNQGLASGTFANAAQNQLFGQNLQAGQFYNAAATSAADDARNRGLFTLGAVQQNNAAQQQEFDELGQRAAFANQGQAQTEQSASNYANFINQETQQNLNNLRATTDSQNAAAQQNFANDSSLYQLGETARQQALQEELAARNQSINETSALMNGGQVQAPQFTQFQAGQVAGTPIGQYIYSSYQGNLSAWQTQQQQQAANNSALFGLGGSILGLGAKALTASDRRLKYDVVSLGVKLPNGLPLYSYAYTFDPEARQHVGVMADQVEDVMPDAVFTMPGGFKAVDYERLL